MRRQARFSDGGTPVARSASALQVWLWLLLFVFQNEFRISRCIQPGYLYFDNLPDTNFTCAGKVIGGYYADLETSCQMFHVCTVGLQEEPMDIKFLCLNGTVFDQETRVCERVDEVDCTKSERFYSLNLELYGNTAPPIIQAEENSQPKPTEESNHQTSNKPSTTDVSDPFAKESPTTPDKIQNQSTETIDSTEDPIQDVKQEDNKNSAPYSTLSSNHHEELNKEYEEDEDTIDDDNVEYEENIGPTSSVTSEIITTTSTTTTTQKPTTTKILPQPTAPPTPISHFITSASPSVSSFSPQLPSHKPSDAPTSTLDPSLLSPQEFIYRHRGPGSEAISFQRQSFRPADGIYITHAPPQQFDHFQYESSRTAPRPSRPVPFVQRPQPTPFRPTTVDPRDQLLRPSQSSQSSERLETAVKHRIQNYPQHLPPQHLPPQQQLPFNPFYYDRKRSEDSSPENESLLSARSVPPLTVTERIPPKPKSPPRVIVTASASVSDSNGKRLNYTVGNVVSDVKPIVAINYDDYKESDLIFDPFFLDVPKLQSRRKTRSSNIRKIVNVPLSATMSAKNIAEISTTTHAPIKSQATTRKIISTSTTSTTTAAWNPEDYVDDNYEPQSYIPPAPPLAVLVTDIKIMKQARSPINDVTGNKIKQKPDFSGKDQTKPTSSHAMSSQSEATVPVPSPTPIEAPACVTSRSTDCRIRA